MKKISFILLLLVTFNLGAQNITTNRKPNGLEHNMLFNANTRYTVTQTGNAKLNLNVLFDGKFFPSYTSTAPSKSDPTVILIEGFPKAHTQRGAWLGWSTRYWQPKRFKIEGYNTNAWVVISDYTNQDYSGGTKHIKVVPFGSYTKFRFTIFSTYGENGKLGLSELFYIHPEVVRPYQGLLAEETWKKSGSSINFSDGNVGIGTTSPSSKLHIKGNSSTYNTLENTSGNSKMILGAVTNRNIIYSRKLDDTPQTLKFQVSNENDFVINTSGKIGVGTSTTGSHRLAVKGSIGAKEIKVEVSRWSDFVFDTSYELLPLKEVEKHIKENGHLRGIPSAKEVEENGIQLGEMNKKLLQKIEELTLYTIQQQKEIEELKEENKLLKKIEKRIRKLEKTIN